MAELFERHDRARFEIYGYSTGRDDGSPLRARLVSAFDHFIDAQALSHAEAAQRIHDDRIDILIDLKGYTGDSRTEILVNRPAPIQVNSLGYPGTMGADFIDYIIADPTTAPLNHQPFYSEAIVDLPHCYQPNDTQRAISATTPSRAACGLPEEGVVFCCFNGAYKLSPPLFDVWMRLLLASPGGVLWLLVSAEGVKANLRREAEARGVGGERLVFGDVLPLEDHLARHRLADLFLDTAPINAHTTASDALWAGLPVLTILGDSFAGRVAASLVRTVGLPELVAASLADYEAIALELAADPAKLAALKARLATQRGTAPLFDIARYTADLERAYAAMVERWQGGLPPRAFSV
jgi:predicted O-linked N-acetylglucosamine transferase (SPINDLY family)